MLRKKIEIKFKVFGIKEKESKRIIERGKIKELERHVTEIETRVEEIQDLKGKVLEIMLESDKEIEEVNTGADPKILKSGRCSMSATMVG